eukprot:15101967-Alexandrium_andersonii.AAC.1
MSVPKPVHMLPVLILLDAIARQRHNGPTPAQVPLKWLQGQAMASRIQQSTNATLASITQENPHRTAA